MAGMALPAPLPVGSPGRKVPSAQRGMPAPAPARRPGRVMTGWGGPPAGVVWAEATLLGRLSPPVRAVLLDLGTGVVFPIGRRIIREGMPGETAYLLLTGCVKVLGNDGGGQEPLLGVRISGDMVGEMAALSGRPRSATITTCAVTSARAIGGGELKAFLREYPEAALEITHMISDRLRWANERWVDFVALDARTRVSRVILNLAETYGRDTREGRDLGAPMTQQEIASLAGVKLASAEKALHALEDAGVVRRGYRSVVVVDLPGLRAAARPPTP